jgi:hypothetical protein
MGPRILLVAVLTTAALFGVYGNFSGPIKASLALPYLLAIPGLSWLSRRGNLKIVDRAVISVSLTMAMEVAIGTLLLVCGLWSPQVGFGMLLAATVAGLACTWTHDR